MDPNNYLLLGMTVWIAGANAVLRLWIGPTQNEIWCRVFFLLPADASAPKLVHQNISAQANIKINPKLTFTSALVPTMVSSPPASRSARWRLSHDLLRLPLRHMCYFHWLWKHKVYWHESRRFEFRSRSGSLLFFILWFKICSPIIVILTPNMHFF
jgi:hypothetical protein